MPRASRRLGDVFFVFGTCRERVVITTDQITLDGQGQAVWKDLTELEVTAALRVNREPEATEDGDYLRAGDAPQTRHSPVSAPS